MKKRPRDESEIHWLGDGISGQESLLAELDPFIYRADQSMFQILRSFHFDRPRGEERARLLLCPPHDAIGFQMGALSEMFSVYINAPEYDELGEEVALKFRVELLPGAVPYELNGRLDCIVYTQYSWGSLEEFRRGVRAAAGLLDPSGSAIFLLPGMLSGTDTLICWEDGTTTELSKLELGQIFLLAAPRETEILPFADITEHEDDYLRRFLKRHRTYFGKAALGAALQRMRDPEFSETLLGAGSRTRCSVVLSWESSGEGLEKIS